MEKLVEIKVETYEINEIKTEKDIINPAAADEDDHVKILIKIEENTSDFEDQDEDLIEKEIDLGVNEAPPLLDDDDDVIKKERLETDSKSEAFSCKVFGCSQIFSNRNSLTEHLIANHVMRTRRVSSATWECLECYGPNGWIRFRSKEQLERHLELSHSSSSKIEPPEELVPQKTSPENLDFYPFTSPWKCLQCHGIEIFSNEEQLKRHQERFHIKNKPPSPEPKVPQETPQKWDNCPIKCKRFFVNYNESGESVVIPPPPPFHCCTCGQIFSMRRSLHEHELIIHETDDHVARAEQKKKEYQPQIQKPSKKDVIFRFDCPKCKECFDNNATLIKHILTMHGRPTVPGSNRVCSLDGYYK